MDNKQNKYIEPTCEIIKFHEDDMIVTTNASDPTLGGIDDEDIP